MSVLQQLDHGPAFPELVRRTRLRAGLTQQQLADLSALSVRAVRDLEAGRVRRPRRDTVRLLADALRLGPAGESALLNAAVGIGPWYPLDRQVDPLSGRETPLPGREAPLPGPEAPLPGREAHLPGREAHLHGREAELAALQDLLLAGDQRLISVVGLPGVGKTRLVDELGHRVTALGWQVVREATVPPATDRATLLIIDPADPAGIPIADLPRRYPALRVVLCAARPLDLPGERVLPLAGLPIPAPGTPLIRQPAVELFVSHARRTRPELVLDAAALAAIAELCRLLDGVPAAIGNAAEWSLVLSWPQLLAAARRDPLGIAEPPSAPAGSRWRDAVYAAIRRLPSEQVELLRQLAASGRSWSLDALCHRSGRQPVELAKALHALTLRGLVSSHRTGDGPIFDVPRLVRRALVPC